MKYYIILFLKGMGMGVANVIPGVSGGTIALITEIYEDLITSLKSFDRKALSLFFSLKIKEFVKYTNFYFLASIFLGSIVSVFTIASLFEYLFAEYPILIWAFFFGLILASIIFVGKRVESWNIPSILALILGTIVAFSLSLATPATENANLFFVFICGIIGISGMMLPGLSGSYILILLGNYKLLMVTAITELNIPLLTTFLLGSVFGLISFSHLLSWILKEYKNATLALLTGFILGSLKIIWPWKKITESLIIDGNEKVISYNIILPSTLDSDTISAIVFALVGFIIVYFLEDFSKRIS
jgi:putative membrane protein